jgi:hypothetical protein
MVKLLAVLGIKYTYWKIIAVVNSTMLNACFFSVVQYKVMFISYHSNMCKKEDRYFFFPFFSFVILQIYQKSRI